MEYWEYFEPIYHHNGVMKNNDQVNRLQFVCGKVMRNL